MYVHGHTHATTHVWGSEDSYWESVFSFLQVGCGDWTQTVRLDSKCLYHRAASPTQKLFLLSFMGFCVCRLTLSHRLYELLRSCFVCLCIAPSSMGLYPITWKLISFSPLQPDSSVPLGSPFLYKFYYSLPEGSSCNGIDELTRYHFPEV